MKKFPKFRKIPYSQNQNFIYVDFAYTSSKWSGSLIQISALHGEESLNLYVQPSNFENVDEELLLEWTGIQWDGSTITKNGIAMAPDQVLEPVTALVELMSWLTKRKPAVIMSYNYFMNDNMQIIRLLRTHGLLGKFHEICDGFTNVFSAVKNSKGKGKPRILYMRELIGDESACLPDAKSLKLLVEAEGLSPQDLLKHSYDLRCLEEYEIYKEEMYQRKCTFQLLLCKDILNTDHIRRLAYNGLTFPDLVALFLLEGEEEIDARLSEVGTGYIRDFVFMQSNLEEIKEEDRKKVCDFLTTTFQKLKQF